MTGQEAVELIRQEAWTGRKPGLSRTRELLKRVGNPHQKLKYVHITGTNGKGSTAAMVASVLDQAGLTVGLYTSPHLWRFHERFQMTPWGGSRSGSFRRERGWRIRPQSLN